jgi:hypothetical protein
VEPSWPVGITGSGHKRVDFLLVLHMYSSIYSFGAKHYDDASMVLIKVPPPLTAATGTAAAAIAADDGAAAAAGGAPAVFSGGLRRALTIGQVPADD